MAEHLITPSRTSLHGRWSKLFPLLLLLVANSCDCGGEPMVPHDMSSDVDADGVEDVATGDAAGDGLRCDDSHHLPVEIGGWTIGVSYSDGSWSAAPTDTQGPGLRGPAVCNGEVAVRLLDEPAVARHAFGNFQIDLTGENVWTDSNGAPPRMVPGDGVLDLEYVVGDQRATLHFSAGAAGGLSIELVHDAQSAEFRVACERDESFFGLGTQATGMDLRGRTYPLWTQEQGNGKPEGGGTFPFNNDPEAAYAPMGVLHSTAGWSGVVTHDGYTEVDLCNSSEDFVAIRSHRANPGLVFVSGTPRERMTAVTEYTGRVRDDVPPWAFGLWVDSVTGPERLATVTNALRDNQIPASAIWSEDWIGGASSTFGFRLSYDWVWDETHYPDLPTLVDDLHSRGFAFLAYFNTFVPQPTSIFPIAQANGYLVQDAAGEPFLFTDPAFRNAGLVDLFNPAAVDWLRDYQLTAVNDIGIDGWMADFSEWYPLEAPDVWENHNVYALQWQRVNDAHMREARPDGNYVFFPRSGWASVNGGSGGVAPVMWGGDQNTNWQYDDGFPTIIPMGAHVGLSGVAIFGSDIAGYNTVGNFSNTSKELWFRWTAAAAFHPLMRTHHGGDECANWNFDRDAETLDHLRRWSSIHGLLYPEFQRLYREAQSRGWPITRHPWLVEASPALWRGDQYGWFLGDDLWISPVLNEGATTATVNLPAAAWWPLFGSAPQFPAPMSRADLDVPVTEVPVFVRPRRALVLAAEPVDSFYGATDGAATDLGDIVDRYRVAMYPDVDGFVETSGGAPFQLGGRELGGFDASAATFAGAALPPCPDPVTASCVDGEVVWLVDVIAGSLEAGSATVDVDSPAPVTIGVGVGRAAWGTLADPTTYAPNPAAASWCPPE